MGDRLHSVNGQSMNGATREEAIDCLQALGDDVTLRVEHSQDEFALNGGQLSDNFYIRLVFFHKVMGLFEI